MAAPRSPQFRLLKIPKPQPALDSLHSQGARPGWPRRPPAPVAAPQAQPAQAVHLQAREKKKAGSLPTFFYRCRSCMFPFKLHQGFERLFKPPFSPCQAGRG